MDVRHVARCTFLTESLFSDRDWCFWQDLYFLTETDVFDRISIFWQRLMFLTGHLSSDRDWCFWQDLYFLTENYVFDRIYIFWQIDVFDRISIFWQKLIFFTRSLFSDRLMFLTGSLFSPYRRRGCWENLTHIVCSSTAFSWVSDSTYSSFLFLVLSGRDRHHLCPSRNSDVIFTTTQKRFAKAVMLMDCFLWTGISDCNRDTKGGFTHSMPCPCRSPAMPCR
jgi:hypothetical protein